MGRLGTDELVRLDARDVQVLIHPSDIVISGRPLLAARARATLAEHLTRAHAYLTWHKEANEVEDELRAVWAMRPEERAALRGVGGAVPETLLAERALLTRDPAALGPGMLERALVALAAAAPVLAQAEEVAERVRETILRKAS